MPDGDYTLSLTPLDRARNAGPPVEVGVAVFGAFVGLTPAPVRFFPQDGDTLMPRTVAGFTLKTAAAVRLTILDGHGNSIRTIAGSYPAGPVGIAWDGRTDGGVLAPQGLYRIVAVATVGGRSETHATAVRAGAFEIRPSVTSARRGARISVTIITSEPLKGAPRLTVRQPGVTAYVVKLSKVSTSTWRATWTLKTGGRAGRLSLVVTGSDRLGGRNATSLGLRIR